MSRLQMLHRLEATDLGLGAVQGFMDEYINKAIDATISAESKVIISALQQHLPEANEANIAAYAHRITRVVPPGKPYPIEYWLDINTKKRKLFIAMLEPVTTMDTVDGNFTVKTELRYRV